DVRAELDRPAHVRRAHRGVDDERYATVLRERGKTIEVGDRSGRVGDDLGEDQLGARLDRALEVGCVVTGHEGRVDAEARQRALEQGACPAVQLRRRHDVVARFAQRRDGDEVRGLPARGGDGTDATFETGEALLERGDGRVADARVDVPEL